MIAVITSTIDPRIDEELTQKSFYTVDERLEQTKTTIARLIDSGFTAIYLIDNSPSLNEEKLKELLPQNQLQIHHIQQYQFNNKGINELLMLLYVCRFLPKDEIIFKISGRYYPTEAFIVPVFIDLAVKKYDLNTKTETISTRGYWVKNAGVLEEFLFNCLKEVFSYPERVIGIKGLLKKATRLLMGKKTISFNISIEFAAANVLKQGNYKVTMLNTIGIEGLVAGANHIEKITE